MTRFLLFHQTQDTTPSGATQDPGHRPADYQLTLSGFKRTLTVATSRVCAINLAAIRVVKAVQAEQRYATPGSRTRWSSRPSTARRCGARGGEHRVGRRRWQTATADCAHSTGPRTAGVERSRAAISQIVTLCKQPDRHILLVALPDNERSLNWTRPSQVGGVFARRQKNAQRGILRAKCFNRR